MVSSRSIVQGFCLLFRNTFSKENFSMVASVILHWFYFSITMKRLSLTIEKTEDYKLKRKPKRKKEKKKTKLRSKLKFVKCKCCLGTCISSINYASLLVKVQIKQSSIQIFLSLISIWWAFLTLNKYDTHYSLFVWLWT